MKPNIFHNVLAAYNQAKEEESQQAKDARLFRLDRYFDAPGSTVYQRVEKTRWLVEGMFPLTYLAVLASDPKAGKTCLCTAIAFAVASGQPFAGRAVMQSAVLWCAYEENETERAALMLQLPKFREEPAPVYTSYILPKIDSPDWAEVIEHWLSKTRARLIVIDSLHGAVTGNALGDNASARRVMWTLKEIAARFNCVILVLHHLTKSASRGTAPDRFADSTQILATASMHVHMDAEINDEERRLILTLAGRGPVNCAIPLVSSGILDFRADSRDTKRTAADQILLELRKEPLTAAELATRSGLKLQSVKNALTKLLKSRAIEVLSVDGQAATYRRS